MIGFIVRVLTGGTAAGTFGPWLLLAAVLATTAAGGAAGYKARGVIDAPIISGLQADFATSKGETQTCKAQHEATRADGAEQVIGALTRAASDVTDALNALAVKAAARGKSLDQFLKEIANAPPSKVCGGSAAELAYRRSVSGVVQPLPAVPVIPTAAP